MKNYLAKALHGMVVCGVMATMVGTAYSADKAVMEKGAKVYNEYCKTCHQATGAGIPKVYPPLAKSDYLKSMSNSWGNTGPTVTEAEVKKIRGKAKKK